MWYPTHKPYIYIVIAGKLRKLTAINIYGVNRIFTRRILSIMCTHRRKGNGLTIRRYTPGSMVHGHIFRGELGNIAHIQINRKQRIIYELRS